MKKTILTLLVLCCTAGIVNAQFGGLGKKLKEKAKTAVTQKKNEVQAEAKQEVKQKANQVASNLEPYEQKMDDGSIAFKGDDLGMYKEARKTDWEDLQSRCAYNPKIWNPNTELVERNTLYYLYKWKKACEKGDTEKMVDEGFNRLNWCITQVKNINQDNNYKIKVLDFKQFAADYDKSLDTFYKVMWDGSPKVEKSYKQLKTQADFDTYTKENLARWNWVLDKVDEAKSANKPQTMQFYLNYMVSQREVMLSWKYLKGNENGFAEFDERLKKLLAETPKSFQENNKVLTVEECLAKQKAQEEKWAKEKAEREAERQAAIAANTKPWPKSNMPELQEECLRIFKAKFPDQDVRRVSIENGNWHIQRKNGNIELRLVRVWVDKKDSEGKRIASDYSVCQYYQGGGKYGKTQYHGVGLSSFYIAE